MRTKTRTKVAPTHYPFLLFHGIRTAQLLSSLFVGSVMAYFDWHLRDEGYGIPWTFLVLTAVAFLTAVFLAATVVLHCCCGLNPRLNIVLNVVLFALWGLGFGLLSWRAHGTLTHWCSTENWHDEQGIMVCRLYKAVFAFTLTGFASTICALLLDIHVFKQSTARGRYNQMQGPPAPNQGFGGSSMSLGGFNAESKHAQSGYAVPEGQFGYDTTYRGAPM